MAATIILLVSLFVWMMTALAAAAITFFFHKKATAAQAASLETERRASAYVNELEERAKVVIANAKREVDETKQSLEPLRKYQEIADAHVEAARILQLANSEATQRIQQAQEDSQTIVADSENQLRDIKRTILEEQAILTAVRNQIEGYGDEYLVPSHSLIDDLAEDFTHKQAGVEFKQARATSEWLVKNDKAAECDYREAGRRLNAVHFTLDAFNGKCDSILSRIKEDNFGKLKQEMIDAFHTVNSNGKAFRNARITDEYLSARITELSWGARLQELKRIEKEEQRAIREQMREEEKARRDYEKAIREAEKEERLIQKSMEEARKRLEQASLEEKALYESQLLELQTKLQEAEDKNQRAISMAQQTKRGHVYVISNIGSFGEEVFKIGLTRRLDPTERVRELGDASVPFSFDVHALLFSEDAPALETKLQRCFGQNQVNRVNPRKEFFRVPLSDIRQLVDEMGIEAKWTMKAEALEYRESREIVRKEQSGGESNLIGRSVASS